MFVLALNQFTAAGKALLMYVQLHPILFGIFIMIIVAGLVTIIVPIAMGFSATGPVAGSVAATWHSTIGNVVAGSLFATLQSLTMSGTLVTVGGALIEVGFAGLIGGPAVEWAMNADWTKGQDWGMWAVVAGLHGDFAEEWERSAKWVAIEGLKWAEGASRSYWLRLLEWASEGARSSYWQRLLEWIGGLIYRTTEEAVSNMNWDVAVQGAEWTGWEAWKMTDEGVRSVDWVGVGSEGLKWAGQGINNVDWEGIADGVGWAGKEAWMMTEDMVSDVDWVAAGDSVIRVLTSWW